jgi:endoglucanase
VGEFGGRSVGNDKEGIWQRSLVSYLRQNNLSYSYWTFNPNSADTGGLLLDDWQSVDPEKAALLSGYQFSLLGIEARQSEQAALPGPSDVVAGGLRVRYRTADAAPRTQDAKPEFIIVNAGHTTAPLSSVELRYWFRDDGDQPLVFHCDWAQVGCANVLGEFGSTGQGEWYLGLRFTAVIAPLGVGEDSGEIKVRFNRSDWLEMRQDDDYSFGATMNYVEWERVTLYVDGELVWGVEPGSAVAPSLTSATASGAASTPAAAPLDLDQVPVEPSTEQVLGQPLAESESEVGLHERPGAQPIAVWQALASLGLITSVTLAFVLGLSKLRARLGRAKG